MIATRMLPLDGSPSTDDSTLVSRIAASIHDSDDELAHMISTLGRQADIRITLLPRLLAAFPGIVARPVVLDAVLESVLRGEVRAGRSKESIARDLRAHHPELAEAIDAAIVLGSIISTGTETDASAAPPEPPFEVGPLISDGRRRYSVRALISRGRQGGVYLATDAAFSREGRSSIVALKLGHVLSGQFMVDRRSTEEAARARQVRHPNVAVAFDRGVSDDRRPYAVFEFVEGGTLHDRWKANPDGVSARSAVEIALKVCRGVAAIHAAGILHLDIKPGNVLLDRHGEPKVTDFGISIECGASLAEPMTTAANIGGTLGFAAPEQFRLGATLDVRSDTYSLGGLLLSLLTGRAANGSSAEEATRLLNGSVGPADGSVNPELLASVKDHTLRDICSKATSRSPGNRYSSADALAFDLERWQRDEPLPWRKQSRAASVRQWVWRERRVVIAAFASVAVVCVSLGVVVRATLRNEQAERDAITAKAKADLSEKERQLAAEKARTLNRNIQSMIKALRTMESSNVSEGWLAQVAVVEGLYGPTLFGTDETGKQLWNDRVERAKAIASEIRANSPGPSVMALQWDLLAGAWLLISGDAVHAETQLASIQAEAKSILPEKDGIRDLIEKLHASAVILSLANGTTPDAASDHRVAQAISVLKQPDAMETSRSGDGVRRVLASARSRALGE